MLIISCIVQGPVAHVCPASTIDVSIQMACIGPLDDAYITQKYYSHQ